MIATNDTKQVRCAVYTRKSTEENLDLDFNSLDAQREAGEAYIKSQQHEGWLCLPDRYDDGGFSGGNIERPAFQRLMADVQAGKVDCILVYKIDRLRLRHGHAAKRLAAAAADAGALLQAPRGETAGCKNGIFR